LPPDCASAEQFARRLAAVKAQDSDWVDVYHFGVMRLLHLDWIRAAPETLESHTEAGTR
jgi:hypothetical protein